MNVNVAWRFRIGGGIQVPLRPLCLSIGQIEVVRALRAESLRSCSPPFGFLPSEFGSHVRNIIKSQVACFQRHGHPVHSRRLLFFCGNNGGGDDTSCSHSDESATVKNDHDEPPDPSSRAAFATAGLTQWVVRPYYSIVSLLRSP